MFDPQLVQPLSILIESIDALYMEAKQTYINHLKQAIESHIQEYRCVDSNESIVVALTVVMSTFNIQIIHYLHLAIRTSIASIVTAFECCV